MGVIQLHVDAVVVGGGFSGISMLYRLRRLGLKTKILEAGGDLGGTWYWNCYPGARVDSEWPFYQLSIPEVYDTFRFTQRFPDHHELRSYFAHVNSILDIKSDAYFNARVVDCHWDEGSSQWTVCTEGDQHVITCKYLMLCSGALVRPFMPKLPGLENFKGTVYHSGRCPPTLEFQNKKVAVMGTGATGIQLVQEVGKQAEHLTVFMRRPSYCAPSGQQLISESEIIRSQNYLGALFKAGRASASGFPMPGSPKDGFHHYTPAQREHHWERIWSKGGFSFRENNFHDVVTDVEANRGAYDFWARKVRARMTDPVKMNLLAPLPADRAPYYIFTKRMPLEIDFYEVADQSNVEIVDINANPLASFNESGVRIEKDDRQIDLDLLILATGYDAFSGAVASMGLKNKSGADIKDCWADGIKTYLGLMTHGFPNAFMVFSSHAPTAFSNATTIIETQCDLVCAMVEAIESSGQNQSEKIKSVEAQAVAEDEWVSSIDESCSSTLLQFTASWWNAANGANKKPQHLNYIFGVENYEKECRGRIKGWQGFDVKY